PIKTSVAVDFLIYVTPQILPPCDNDLPPVFAAPSPVNGNVFNLFEGQNLAFTVNAEDPDAGNVVTLNSGGTPAGSLLTPGLPNTGNPVSTDFSWTPALGSAGAYVVTFTATDSCGLQALISYTINVAPNPVVCTFKLSLSNTKTTCLGSCDGTLTANPSQGTPLYSYLWSDGQTTKTAVGLCAGTYTVTVTDSKGCTAVKSCVVKSPAAVKASLVCVNVKCKGSSTGSLTANPSGGSGTGYTYLWSNAETTKTISGLPAGPYTVTVTDSKGCTGVVSKSITEPAKYLAVTTTKTACTNCNPCNGTATANPTGGVAPYTYLWSNGQTVKKALGLCAGTYTVTVTDKNGCTNSCSATVTGCSPQRLGSITENGLANLYPNPFAQNFTLNFAGEEAFNVKIFDIKGSLVAEYKNNLQTVELGSDLPRGLYMIYISTESGYLQSLKALKSE
ncbi:MAG: T9SS type A sorting domain-containing protein, partial [Bacteroidota bacterium]